MSLYNEIRFWPLGGGIVVIFSPKTGALIELTRRKSAELNGKVEKNTTFSGAMKLKAGSGVEEGEGGSKIISRRPCHFLG